MRPLAAHIGNIGDDVAGYLSLNAETPLLSVGPDCFCRNSSDVERENRSSQRSKRGFCGKCRNRSTGAVGGVKRFAVADIANARIVKRERLRHAKHERSTGLQRARVSFISGTMLKEYAVASAPRVSAIAYGIPRKTNSRRWIEQMPLQAACRCTVDAALNQTQSAHYSRI